MGIEPVRNFCLACMFVICSAATWSDCSCRRIPNGLILLGLFFTAVAVLAEISFIGVRQSIGGRMAAGGLAALLHGIPYALGQMGAGDLKLAMLMGILLGWQVWNAYLVCYAFVLSITAGILFLIPVKFKQSSLPLAPFMGAAFFLCLFNDPRL